LSRISQGRPRGECYSLRVTVRVVRAATLMVCVAGLFLVACHREKLRTGDLDEIRAAAELRVIVRPGFLTSPVHTAGRVDQAALFRHLAARLGVSLRWVQARRNDQVLDWLRRGRGDIGVHRFSPTGLRRVGMAASAAVDWVDDLLVAYPPSGVDSVDNLNGHVVYLQPSALRWEDRGLLDDRTKGPEILPIPEEVSLEEVLRRVSAGRYALSVADSGLVQSMAYGSHLKVVGALAENRSLVWALRPNNSQLRTAVDDFLFAEKVLSLSTRTIACRDLPDITRERVLRLVTRNSPTTCTVATGGLQGFEYDLALAFARSLGVRLELVIPPPTVSPLNWLERGYGDLAALHEPLLRPNSRGFLATRSYRRTDLVAVLPSTEDPPAAVEDLAGRRIVVSEGLSPMLELLPEQMAMRTERLGPGSDALSAMASVETGATRLALADADTARLELPDRPALEQGPTVIPGCQLRWILSTGSPRLRDAANRFLGEAGRSGLLQELALSELYPGRRYRPRHVPPTPPGGLTPYDPILQKAVVGYRLDWRLVASLMYEESRFDPKALGPGGSAGLFQFMPATWGELGGGDPDDPREAIPAGIRYLSRLMDEFSDVPMADRVAMSLAAYNVGPRHVADARRLAKEMGLDPDRWSGNVETAMVLLDNPDVARRFPAGVCRCRRAVAYTRRILRRYTAYTEQFPATASPGL